MSIRVGCSEELSPDGEGVRTPAPPFGLGLSSRRTPPSSLIDGVTNGHRLNVPRKAESTAFGNQLVAPSYAPRAFYKQRSLEQQKCISPSTATWNGGASSQAPRAFWLLISGLKLAASLRMQLR